VFKSSITSQHFVLLTSKNFRATAFHTGTPNAHPELTNMDLAELKIYQPHWSDHNSPDGRVNAVSDENVVVEGTTLTSGHGRHRRMDTHIDDMGLSSFGTDRYR
jgi:hypothetical protein